MSDVQTPQKISKAIKTLVEEKGAFEIGKQLGVTKDTVARLVAGMTVRSGTIALVEQKLSALKKAPKKSAK